MAETIDKRDLAIQEVRSLIAVWKTFYDPEKIEREWDLLDFKLSIIMLNMGIRGLEADLDRLLKESE